MWIAIAIACGAALAAVAVAKLIHASRTVDHLIAEPPADPPAAPTGEADLRAAV